jgi:hypothetical protein
MGGAAVVTVARLGFGCRGLAGRGEWVPPSAHVPRSRPFGRSLLLNFAEGGTHSPRPAGMAGGVMSIDRSLVCRLRAVDGPRSEVKEEGRAMPGPGDMSGGDRPLPAVRKVQKSANRGLSTC